MAHHITYVDVAKGDNTRAFLELAHTQRGVLKVGLIEVFTRYPLGFFHAWSYVDFGQSVLVYPQPDPDPGPLPSGVGGDDQEGSPAPGNDEFAGLRDYQPGDNPRRISWKALAREQGLLTKEFHGYQSGDLWLDYTMTPGINPERRLARLCAWVLDADRKGLTYGLRMPGLVIERAAGGAHRASCLEALARF